MKDFYKNKVYVYCDPRYLNNNKGYKYKFKEGILRLKNKPFYIGCAGYDNHLRHLGRNRKNGKNELVYQRIKKIREEKLDPVVKILKVYKDRKKARKLEEILIIAVGRQDLKTGPLLNRLDGYKNLSLKASRIRSEKTKRNWKNFEYKKKMSEKKIKDWENPEYRKKMSEKRKKMWENSEYRENISKINRGEKNSSSKLTEKKVLKIRKLEEKGWSFLDLAERYEVSQSCIYHIIERHTWNHI